MTRIPTRPTGMITAAALALGLGFGAMAQTVDSWPDQTLETFAQKVVELGEIRASYAQQIEAAASPEEQQQLMMQADQEMVEAVQSEPPMSVEEYNAIAQAAAQDPELAERVAALIEQRQPGMME
ncbi:MAG: DUF4168 domain-containing protein [Rubrimonas sp.]